MKSSSECKPFTGDSPRDATAPPERMPLLSWAGIAAALGGVLALSFLLNERLHHLAPFIFIYPVVAVAGYLGGGQPAVLVGLIAAAVSDVWHPALPMREILSAVVCALFLLTTGTMAWLSEELQRARKPLIVTSHPRRSSSPHEDS